MLAMVSGSSMTYYHGDHLSTRVTTDAAGNRLGEEGHFPFGEVWYQTGPNNKWFFTTYNRDSESGLDYALARYYNSRTGTFCSADPVAGSVDDPQSWNRYPYGRNDPIDITDPSGQDWFFSFMKWFVTITSFVAQMPEVGILFASADAPAQLSVPIVVLPPKSSVPSQGQPAQHPSNQGQRSERKPPTPCMGHVYVMRGNRSTIGHQGGMERTVTKNSAAVDPAQWGATTGADMRGYSDQISGDISTPGYGSGRSTFGNVRDVVNNRQMRSGATGAGARAEIRNRVPGALVIELPGLGKGPQGRTGDPSSLPNGKYKGLPGTVFVPAGTPCPQGTEAPPGMPAPPAPPM